MMCGEIKFEGAFDEGNARVSCSEMHHLTPWLTGDGGNAKVSCGEVQYLTS